ncbi:hypothetical protein AAFP30_08220 [Gordonia sp. CPCC 205515]|uniref:hypothetical protein n=1 Tax=Gordonia sp. CPCC 205515 TaxID=3140791 RepID=UPI003AF3C5E8
MPAQAWATLVVGVVATVGVIVTILQRNRSENRSEWWRRFQWALDATHSDVPQRRDDGWAVIAELMRSPLMTPSEEVFIKVVAQARAMHDTGAGTDPVD